jgi:hypothetical protein
MTAGLEPKALEFLEKTHSAAMVTRRADGTAHAVRVGIAIVDSKIWSSGTQARKRTAFLRRDPRATLLVFEGAWPWLTLECHVRMIEGEAARAEHLRLFRVMQGLRPGDPIAWYGSPKTEEEFLHIMVEEQRLIYEFDVLRSYGMYGEMPTRS